MADETPKDELPFDDAEESPPAIEVDDGSDDDFVEPKGSADEGEDDSPDWDAMAKGNSEFDDFTSQEYVKGTTQEYQGLAEEVERASTEEWELQAVAASLPGVESGLVGFEDVSGTESQPEEAYEAAEQAATSDLTLRVGSALVIFGLFLGSLVLGGWWFTIFVILIMVVSVGEFYATLRTVGYKPLALFGLLGVIMMGVGAHTDGAMAVAGWGAAAAGATILFYSLTPRRNAIENVSATVLGMAWVGMLSFALAHRSRTQPGGPHLLHRHRHRDQRHRCLLRRARDGSQSACSSRVTKEDHRRLGRRVAHCWNSGCRHGRVSAMGIDWHGCCLGHGRRCRGDRADR